ncbi:MAG: hypothetical protein HIU92_08545 [Proteobacteria bacterium]|nr:hypothetical protein [Pseudomonadota bacterium]
MTEAADDDDRVDHDEPFDRDEWANAVGDDAELERLWAGLMEATADAEPKAMEQRIAEYFATLGARSRRTTEGLVLAVTAATATEGPGWEDWRVVLHRHFARDERMEVAVAAAILLALRESGDTPDWHATPERAMTRVIRSFVRDMRLEMDAIESDAEAAPASATLVTLASELFDVAIALRQEQLDELQNSAEIAGLLADLSRQLGAPADGHAKPVADNMAKARALVEVTIRQLELGAADVH